MPDVTRRVALGLAAGVGLVVATPAAAQAATPAAARLAIPGRSAYLRGLGGTFTAAGTAGRFRLKLVEIADVPVPVAGRAAHLEKSFNLIFQPVGAVAPAGIYRIGSTLVAQADLHLSPVDRVRGQRLQALINRSGAA